MTLLLVAMAPAAMANPTYSVPDPSVVTEAAQDSADGVVASAGAFSQTIFGNASSTAQNAQNNEQPEFPADAIANVSTGAGTFGSSVFANGGAFLDTAATFVNATVEAKVNEAFATVNAVGGLAALGIEQVRLIARAAYQAICGPNAVSALEPGACEDGSIVQVITSSVLDAGENAAQQAQALDFADLKAQVEGLLTDALGAPVDIPDLPGGEEPPEG